MDFGFLSELIQVLGSEAGTGLGEGRRELLEEGEYGPLKEKRHGLLKVRYGVPEEEGCGLLVGRCVSLKGRYDPLEGECCLV